MNILGIICGRPAGNSELLAKQALKGARDQGAVTELVNLRTIDLKPCAGCGKCHDFAKAKFGTCPVKDDFKWLENKILDADGLVVVMPCYEKSPPSEFKALMDRTGPANDVHFRKVGKARRMSEPEKFNDGYEIDERSFKTRFASFITHGGTNWTQLGLPLMLEWCTSLALTPVDKYEAKWNLGAAFNTELMNRIYRSGSHVAKCCAHPDEDAAFYGDPGHCPICHNDAMILGKTAEDVRCLVCNAQGTLQIDEYGNLKISFTPEGLAHSSLLNSGREEHYNDMMKVFRQLGSFDWKKYKEACASILESMEVAQP